MASFSLLDCLTALRASDLSSALASVMPAAPLLSGSALVLLALLATTSLVAGGYTPCSDPTVCSSCCTSITNNGAMTTYCCPGIGNSFDYGTKQCEMSPDCSQLRGGDRNITPLQRHCTDREPHAHRTMLALAGADMCSSVFAHASDTVLVSPALPVTPPASTCPLDDPPMTCTSGKCWRPARLPALC